MVDVDPGSSSIPELYKVLETTSEGLTLKQSEDRSTKYGKNILVGKSPKSILRLILEQFEDRLVQILLAVAVLSGLFSYVEAKHSIDDVPIWKSFVEPLVILAILVINAAVGVWQTRSAQGSLEALKKMQPSLATVLREGDWQSNIDAADVVPGDILEIRVGDKVPADARLIQLQTSSMQVDEGSLTGESVTVSKLPGEEGTVSPNLPIQDQVGMLYSSTVITSGAGRAVVVHTGMATQIGKIQQGVTDAEEDQPKTPLAIKLDEFGNSLTVIIGGICLFVWIISIPKMSDPTFANVWEGAVYYAKVAVALGVAAIPEGLPAVITLCLSLGTRRMAKRNVIVRKLPSVETLGCTSVICTDKTGTLTTNEMTVVSLVLLEEQKSEPSFQEHHVEGFSYAPIGIIDGIISGEEVKRFPRGAVAEVAAVSALCNDAKILGHDTEKIDEKRFERVGEPTEAALCVLAEKVGGMTLQSESDGLDVPPSVLANANVNAWRSTYSRIATLEFNRDRKSMSVLCKMPNDSVNKLLVKGAPNLLIDRCTSIMYRDGSVVRLTGELRRKISAKVTELATRPLRCLALAVKDSTSLEPSLKNFKPSETNLLVKHPLLKDPSNYKDVESGLTLVGIVGIKDPARPEVADSINRCTEAGIRIMMITGDARDTAIAIARDVNIFSTEGNNEDLKAFEGREFFQKSEKEQLAILKSGNIVFCRAEPADKQKLVKMLQSLDEIPAMTGDGVNDAAALQQSAIGIAMGITGTEVAKEAADMILADDNFSTIVAAVEEGRCIYANMQAFICFLISCNIGEIFAILIATIFGFPEPLTAMHLLWVNLVTDGPPATALGFNPPSPNIMTQQPRPSNEPILTKWLLIRYCVTGLYVGIATVGVFVGHYLKNGISLWELANWGKCGATWTPSDETLTCNNLFQESARSLPQTLSLTTLVVMEMLKALSAVSMDSSLLHVGPFENPWLILGVSIPFLLHLAVLYSGKLGIPALGESFGFSPLTVEHWTSVLYWALPILLVDEILKAIGRHLQCKDEKKKANVLHD
eukprot:CAMPEP_0194213662 /NCGR_PEP_ID=MMETSP0156-20130528/14402_1 /TAXON_ID=33649 /ORGANISM="Thalassionema nitzschioides, Strain L26-B" /LENGTH=1041 /DNA_ID=CAMNT_0038941743 /DNA_START=244 /DNA_END=3369 /DNA_ORIENTATION=-